MIRLNVLEIRPPAQTQRLTARRTKRWVGKGGHHKRRLKVEQHVSMHEVGNVAKP